MSPEFWAIIGVGVALTAAGVTAITLGWSMYARLDACLAAIDARFVAIDVRFASIEALLAALDARLAAVEKGQARIEGWIAGRFREEAAP